MAHKVFISYAAEDKAIADAVCNALEARGVGCWYAPRDVTYGKDFDEVIVDAICDSKLMVLILSGHSNSSAHVKREVQNACMEDADVPVLPFRVEDVPLNKALRYYLGAVHWLDALTPPLEGHLNNLVQHVEARLPRTAPLPKLVEPDARDVAPPLVSKQAVQAEAPPVTKAAPLAGDAGSQLTFKKLIENPVLLVGQKIGPYVIQETVGSGGSGLVYRASHGALGQTACIKVFYPLNEEGPDAFRNIARGVRGLAAMNHPHIIRVFDLEQIRLADALSLYLVMEFVRGQALDEWSRGLPESDDAISVRMQMALDLAKALAAAHSCRYIDEVGFEQVGILHGDIKPANIIVRENNSPVVLDFMMLDVQRLLDSRFMSHRIPNDDVSTGAFGTPGFMAPEQEGQGIVTARTDVYGLGMTFCYLFFPYFHNPILKLRDQDSGAEQDQLPSALRELLRAMLAAPDARPKDMDEVAQRLRAIADSMKAQTSSVKAGAELPIAATSSETGTKITAPLKPPAEAEPQRTQQRSPVEDRPSENIRQFVQPATAQPLKGKIPEASQRAAVSGKIERRPQRRFRETSLPAKEPSKPVIEPSAPVIEPATKASTLITLLFAVGGAIIFLVGGLLFWQYCKLYPNRYFYSFPSGVTLRDTVVGLLGGITLSEFFRPRRWSVAAPHRMRAFLVHGATTALISMSLLFPLAAFDILYWGPPPYSLSYQGNKFVNIISKIYTHPDIALLIGVVGFIVGLVICGLRIRGQRTSGDTGTEKRRPRFRVVVLYAIAGAFILGFVNIGPGRIDHWWLLTIRDTLFGVFLGIAISEMRPSALWSIRDGERGRALLAHVAAGAAIGMVCSGAIRSSISDFYSNYYSFYFKAPMLLAIYGAFIGAAIYAVRVMRRKSKATKLNEQ